jgi:hypothetical protein
MRTRKRVALLLASAAALGVGLIALPASAAATPPVVPTCTFPNTTGSDSCATLRVNAFDGSLGATTENVGLGVRVRSQFNPATSESTVVDLSFDNDIAINLAGIPACPASELTGKNVAAAWEQCGPGADGTPASEGNAYLSTGLGAQVSGIGSSTVDPGGVACTMIFKGADNAHLTIYARVPVANASTTGCNNPATNTAGNAAIIFTGTLTQIAAPYKWKLHVPGTQAANPALDDFYSTVKRAAIPPATTSAFRAKCVSPMRMLGFWDYTAGSDANDTFLATDPCPP